MRVLGTGILASALACFLVLLSAPAMAQSTANLSWVNATKNTDNTNIPATGVGSLTRTTVDYGTCTAAPVKTFNVKQGEMFIAPPANTATVALVVIQEYCFRAWHTNTYGNTSPFSNVVAKANLPPTPQAPSGLTVAADLTAYSDDKIRNGKLMRAVGVVAAGTSCNTSEALIAQGVTYYAVPAAAVTASPGTALPLVVYSRCG